jgi:peptidoglycan/LPS O-acetylase OafA/YrhL
MESKPNPLMGRVPELDGLRGVAVILVVLFHYVDRFPLVGIIASRGWVGVDLFFVLSGFLIGGIVISNRDAANLFPVFYVRRFLRIFPLYYLVLGTLLALMMIGLAEPHNLLAYFVYVQNIVSVATGDPGPEWLQPTWSLAMEEQFYIVLPLIVWYLPPRALGRVFVGGILLAILLRVTGFLLPLHNPGDFSLFFTPCRADGLFYGVLLALLMRSGKSLSALIPYCYAVAALTLTVFLAVYSTDWLVFTVGLTSVGPFFFCVVALAIIHKRGPIAIVTRMAPLRWVGIRAYAIYLLHMPVLLSIRELPFLPNVLVKPLCIAVVAGLAAASWKFLEAPLIKMGHRLKYFTIPESGDAAREKFNFKFTNYERVEV